MHVQCACSRTKDLTSVRYVMLVILLLCLLIEEI
jgi:hypothetical protein